MPQGTFTNIHYLGGFTAFVLPILTCFFLNLKGPKKLFLLVPILMDFDLLLRTGSRPSILGLIIGVFFAVVFLIRGRYKWYSIGLIFIALLGVYFTDYGGMETKIENLIVNADKEERLQLYRNAWLILKQNTPTDWLIGHGISKFSVSLKWTNNFSVFEEFIYQYFCLDVPLRYDISNILEIFALSLRLSFRINVAAPGNEATSKYSECSGKSLNSHSQIS